MKIYVNARFLTQPVSGVQRYGIECSRQISKKHTNIVFLSPPDILHKVIAAELGAEVIGKNKGHLWEQIDLPRYLAKQGHPPLLNLANTAPLSYSNNYITIHDLSFYHHPEWNSKLFSKWYNFLLPRLARKTRHIFTVSNTMRDEIIKHYHIAPPKVSVTYNGLSQNILQYPQEDTVKEKIILSVGSFNTRKNHHSLIKAFIGSNVKKRYRLVIIGDKNKVFSESGLDEALISNNNIDILQRLTEGELAATYAKAEIIVSLSMYEGFGIPVLEGLYFGCKVLCSDIPVYRELYDKYAYFCSPYAISDIQAALETVAGSDSKGSDAKELFEKYSYPRAADTILQYIVPGTPDTIQ